MPLIRAPVQYPTTAKDVPEGRLFGEQKATRALLNFIATTEVGMRRGEGIREAERARRDDEWGLGDLDEEEQVGEG